MMDELSPWTDRDTALWHTCELAASLARGERPVPQQAIAAAFPPRFAYDEQYWASGGFTLSTFFASGDGTYESRTTFVGGTGLFGMTLGAATLVGSALGNAKRRRAAELAAAPRWQTTDGGVLYASGHGVYLQSARAGVVGWSWSDIVMGEMVGPGQLQLQAVGNEPMILGSDWAELVFATWALCRFPQHHQLLTGAWLPPGWLAHAAAHRYRTRMQRPELVSGS
jgi:hypothetical protein